MNNLEFHVLIEKDGPRYSALCLELDVASQGRTAPQARANLREAVLLYLDDVYAAREERTFVPRPAPREEWVKYFEASARRLAAKMRLPGRGRRVVLQDAVYG